MLEADQGSKTAGKAGMLSAPYPHDLQRLIGFNRWLLTLLPVETLRQLLEGLAQGWCTLCVADAACICTESPDAEKLWISWSCAGQSPVFAEREVSDTEQLREPDILRILSEEPAPIDLSVCKATVIPFDHKGMDLGTAVLLTRENCQPRSDLLPELSRFSARLVLQGRLLAGLCPAQAESEIRSPDDRLEALAEFAAGAGHEINNPLASISGRVQQLLRDETNPERREALLTIGGQTYRIRDMIGDVMLFARPPTPHPELLDLSDVVESVLAPLRERAAERGCTFDVHLKSDISVPIWADRVQLSVVIESLVQNSLDALIDGGTISVDIRSGQDGVRETAVLAVSDFGPGLSEQDRRHLFDPFYSGRQAGRGLGFGLSKCWRIVLNHRGRIEVSSLPGAATTFTVSWPVDPVSPNDPAGAVKRERD